jgi:hypothetical protein
MRITYVAENGSVVAVSTNEPPSWQLPTQMAVRFYVDKPSASNAAESSIVVEVAINREPRRIYGMLGARYTPSDRGGLVTVVPITEDLDVSLHRPSGRIDPEEVIRPGLPSEYAGSVLVSAADQLRKGSHLGQGTLVFSWAAHGRIGSNDWVFIRLASTVVASFNLEIEQELLGFLEEKFLLKGLSRSK